MIAMWYVTITWMKNIDKIIFIASIISTIGNLLSHYIWIASGSIKFLKYTKAEVVKLIYSMENCSQKRITIFFRTELLIIKTIAASGLIWDRFW